MRQIIFNSNVRLNSKLYPTFLFINFFKDMIGHRFYVQYSRFRFRLHISRVYIFGCSFYSANSLYSLRVKVAATEANLKKSLRYVQRVFGSDECRFNDFPLNLRKVFPQTGCSRPVW